MDEAKIKALEERVTKLKGEVEWFKKQAYPSPTSTEAQVFVRKHVDKKRGFSRFLVTNLVYRVTERSI